MSRTEYRTPAANDRSNQHRPVPNHDAPVQHRALPGGLHLVHIMDRPSIGAERETLEAGCRAFCLDWPDWGKARFRGKPLDRLKRGALDHLIHLAARLFVVGRHISGSC